DGLNLSEDDYRDYYDGLTSISNSKRKNLSIELHSKQATLKEIDREIKDISLNIVKFQNETIIKANEDRIAYLQEDKINLEAEIDEIKSKITKPEEDQLSIQEFLNLSKSAGNIVKSGNAIVKDTICRMIFLNFVLNEEKVASFSLKEPFA